MADPCSKAEDITAIRERLEAQAREMARDRSDAIAIKATINKISEAMTRIAEQTAELRHLREDCNRNERDIDSLFNRVRIIELSPGRAAGKFFWVIVTGAAGTVGGIISGIAIWLIKGGVP